MLPARPQPWHIIRGKHITLQIGQVDRFFIEFMHPTAREDVVRDEGSPDRSSANTKKYKGLDRNQKGVSGIAGIGQWWIGMNEGKWRVPFEFAAQDGSFHADGPRVAIFVNAESMHVAVVVDCPVESSCLNMSWITFTGAERMRF